MHSNEGPETSVSPSPGGPAPPHLEWKFGQVFGERAAGEEVQEVDIISAIEFDKTGDRLATGDRGGRVVLFDRVDGKDGRTRREMERSDIPQQRQIDYRYSTEFQSHEPEFDYLKSLEIEEKINKIRWCQLSNSARFLLSTNDKTVKLWKVYEKQIKAVTQFNLDPQKVQAGGDSSGALLAPTTPVNVPGAPPFNPRFLRSGGQGAGSSAGLVSRPPTMEISSDMVFPSGGFPSLKLPTVVSSHESALVARCRRIYGNAHAYHINSISVNSDCETFISADDLRVNLWNVEVSSQSFNIVDIKPTNMEDLTEVITSAEFHPYQCHLLAYSSSKGTVRLLDMRQSALCDRHSKLFEEQEAPGNRSFFSEIIASISDVKFSRNGRYLLSRDYMTLKLWDINMEAQPVATFKVHENLRPKLCDLYENDSIFDKFECCFSGDGQRIATGSYSNLFRVFGVCPGSDEATLLESTKTPNRRRMASTPQKGGRLANLARGRRDARRDGEGDLNGMQHDFSSKLLHLAWHPQANLIACAASNSLYMYYA